MAPQALLPPSTLLNLTRPAVPSGRRLSRHLGTAGVSALGALHCTGNTQATPASSPVRRSANYQPTLWRDSFIQSLTSDYQGERHMAKLEELKGWVRNLIDESTAGAAARLQLLDVLRRLGVAYHFEQEIEALLHGMSTDLEAIRRELDGDLLHTALLFRLLREHGLEVSQDVFDSFIDEQGSFSSTTGSLRRSHGPEAMLSLYEASFLACEGEKVLEEARTYALAGLEEVILDANTEAELRARAVYALEMPLHWRVPRVYARWFIDVCERRGKVNPVLLELAKLDFNMVQSEHRRELKALSRWWDELGLQNLSFSRDRIMENFLWTIGVAFEPQFSYVRHGLTQINCLITTIDDVYDVYGTIDELEVFTKAVERWDVDAMEELPDYMKLCFQALLNTTNELALQCYEKKGFYCLPFLKEVWVNLCKAYLREARWYHSKYMPSLREYIGNAWVSISGPVILTHAYFLISDQTAASESSNTIENCEDLIRWSSMILRLSDDLGTSSAELERGDNPKAIQCHMHEKNVSEATARGHIKALVNEAWMKINREYSHNKQLPKSFVNAALNLARMAQCVYQHGDGYGAPDKEVKSIVNSLVIEPIR